MLTVDFGLDREVVSCGHVEVRAGGKAEGEELGVVSDGADALDLGLVKLDTCEQRGGKKCAMNYLPDWMASRKLWEAGTWESNKNN